MKTEEYYYRRYKAEQEFRQSAEYKIMKAVAVIGFIITVILPVIILSR